MDSKKPNITILTVGRCGSSLVAKQLGELGWSLDGCDTEYAEHVEFRRINTRLVAGKHVAGDDMDRLLNTLWPPWVIKDPRLVNTWDHWQPYLDNGRNLLLWLTRDLDEIEASLKRQRWGHETPRGFGLRGMTLAEAHERCAEHFAAWGGPTLLLDYGDVRRTCEVFENVNPGRSRVGRGGLVGDTTNQTP